MLVQVNSLIGAPEDVTLKDGKVIQKQRFLAADGKQYVTFAKVEAGQSYDGEVSPDSFSGELRFKKTKVSFTPRGGGGGESNRQTALKAAANAVTPFNSQTTYTDVTSMADQFLAWLEAGSQGSQVSPPDAQTTQGQQNPVAPATEQPPISAYEEI